MFERAGGWSPYHPEQLDSLITAHTVTELLIPVHQPSHWTLLHVDVTSLQYSYADTLHPSSNMAPPECINLLNAWLGSLFNFSVELTPTPRPFELDQQLDSNSCGVAVLSSMAHYALQGNTQPWAQPTTREHRLQWTHRLLNLSTTGNNATRDNVRIPYLCSE